MFKEIKLNIRRFLSKFNIILAYRAFTRKSEIRNQRKKLDKENRKGWNKAKYDFTVYGKDMNYDQYEKKFGLVHGLLKYKIIVPALYIFKKIIRKAKGNIELADIPLTHNSIVFDKVFEDTIVEWRNNYVARTVANPSIKRKETEENIKNSLKNGSPDLLRTIKDLMLVIVQNDTAYAEFFNMLSFNYCKQLNDEYGENAKHILYTEKRINDITYYGICKLAEQNIQALSLNNVYTLQTNEGAVKVKLVKVE